MKVSWHELQVQKNQATKQPQVRRQLPRVRFCSLQGTAVLQVLFLKNKHPALLISPSAIKEGGASFSQLFQESPRLHFCTIKGFTIPSRIVKMRLCGSSRSEGQLGRNL